MSASLSIFHYLTAGLWILAGSIAVSELVLVALSGVLRTLGILRAVAFLVGSIGLCGTTMWAAWATLKIDDIRFQYMAASAGVAASLVVYIVATLLILGPYWMSEYVGKVAAKIDD